MRTGLDTVRISLACVTDVRDIISESYNVLRTCICAESASNAFFGIHFDVFSEFNGIDRTGLGASTAKNAVAVIILQLSSIVI